MRSGLCKTNKSKSNPNHAQIPPVVRNKKPNTGTPPHPGLPGSSLRFFCSDHPVPTQTINSATQINRTNPNTRRPNLARIRQRLPRQRMAAARRIPMRVAVHHLARLLAVALAIHPRPVRLPHLELLVIVDGEEGQRARAALALDCGAGANVGGEAGAFKVVLGICCQPMWGAERRLGSPCPG
jgi:hypothetical protein